MRAWDHIMLCISMYVPTLYLKHLPLLEASHNIKNITRNRLKLVLDCACIFYFNCGGTFYFQEIAHLKVHNMSCLFQKISAPPTRNDSCVNHPAQESSFLDFDLLKHLTTYLN